MVREAFSILCICTFFLIIHFNTYICTVTKCWKETYSQSLIFIGLLYLWHKPHFRSHFFIYSFKSQYKTFGIGWMNQYSENKTFGDLSDDYFKNMCQCLTLAHRVYCEGGPHRVWHVIKDRSIHDWKTFLSVKESKHGFLNCFSCFILQNFDKSYYNSYWLSALLSLDVWKSWNCQSRCRHC